jgi:type VI secretion system protein ImpF
VAQDRKFEGLGPITLSIMDRLIDAEPKVSTEPQLTYKKSLDITRASLRRDLENLLNVRSTEVPLPQGSDQLKSSLYMYGLPDITSMTANYLHDQSTLLLVVEEALRMFEPRLNPVTVSLVPSGGAGRVLRFVIEGMLRIDPAPEHVVFDASLELISGEYEILGDSRAG